MLSVFCVAFSLFFVSYYFSVREVLGRVPYSPGFEPIAKSGQIARIILLDHYVFARVLTPPEPVIIAPVIVQISNPSTGVTLDTKDYVKLDDNEIGQFRVFSPQPLVYQLKQPPSTSRYGTKSQSGYPFIGAPTHLLEFYVYSDTTPKMQVFPALGMPMLAAIQFVGYKWEIEELPQEPSHYDVDIPVAYAAPRSMHIPAPPPSRPPERRRVQPFPPIPIQPM